MDTSHTELFPDGFSPERQISPQQTTSRSFEVSDFIDQLLLAQDEMLGSDQIFSPYMENLSIIHTCIRVWIDTALICPIRVRKQNDDGEYIRDVETMQYERVLHNPNAEDTYTDFIEKIFRSLAVHGEVFFRCFYSHNSSVPRDIYVVPRREVEVKREQDEIGTRVIFTYKGKRFIKKQNRPGIIQIKINASAESLRGVSSLVLLYKEIQSGRLSLEHTRKTLRDGGTAKAGLMPKDKEAAPMGMNDIQQKQMTDDAKKQTTGPDAYGRFLRIPTGYEVVELPTSEDAEFLLTGRDLRDQIAAAFRIPPHKYNNYEKANLNNIRVAETHFVNNTMVPLYERVCKGIHYGMLPQDTDAEVYFDTTLAAKASPLEEARIRKIDFETGRKTINDFRRADGEATFEDDKADEPYPLLNMQAQMEKKNQQNNPANS